MERNYSVDIFRYIAAILVVALHCSAFLDWNPMVSYLTAQVLPRISVPFFFCISGFFFHKKWCAGGYNPVTFVTKQVGIYALWSSIYYLTDLILYRKPLPENLLYAFFLQGTVYHFWYFPALICISIVVFFCYKFRAEKILFPVSLILYLLVLLDTAYFAIGSRIPGLTTVFRNPQWTWISSMFCVGLPFYVCGTLISKAEHRIVSIPKGTLLLALTLTFAGFFGEVLILKLLNLAKNITITVGLYILVAVLITVLIRFPFPAGKNIARHCRSLANYTYFSHVLFLEFLTFLSRQFFSASIPETLLFFLTAACCCITAYPLSKSKTRLAAALLGQ